MIDHVEAPLAARPVDGGDVDEAPELAALVVAQERDDLHDVGSGRRDGELAVRDRVPEDATAERAGDGLAEFVERLVHAEFHQSTMKSRAPFAVCERCASAPSATW